LINLLEIIGESEISARLLSQERNTSHLALDL